MLSIYWAMVHVDWSPQLWTVVHICGLWSILVDFDPHLWTLIHICGHWSTFVDIDPHLWTLVHICGLWSTFVDIDPHLWTLIHNCGLMSTIVDYGSYRLISTTVTPSLFISFGIFWNSAPEIQCRFHYVQYNITNNDFNVRLMWNCKYTYG